MDEKIKEIQERWHRLPIPTYNQSARDIGYLLLYIWERSLPSERERQDHADKLGEIITQQTNKSLQLEFRIKELEERQKWIDEIARPDRPDDERPWCAAYLDCRKRIKELEGGIKDFLDCFHGEDHNIPERVMDKLKKLVEK
jgi:hypothetical protein